MRPLRDSNLTAKIEASRRRLVDRLSREFPYLRLSDLRQACETLESELIAFLADIAMDNAPELFSMRKSEDGLHLLDDRSAYYQIVVARSVREPSQNIIFLRPLEYDNVEQPREFLFDIAGYGSCRSIAFLYVPKDAYRVNFSLVHSWFKGIFESGYHWFFEVAGGVTNYQLADLANRLYGHSRKYIPRETLGANLWFSVIVNGFGFRLAEPHVASNAFRIIDANNRTQAHSTNRYVSELLGTFLPENIMLMRKAIDQGVCVDVNLSGTEYRREGSIYAVTLTALYGHESFTVYPIFKGRDLSVGAVFPTEVRIHVEPILDQLVGDLAAICSNYKEPSGESLKIFTSSAYMIP
jgi:hypothetical protein